MEQIFNPLRAYAAGGSIAATGNLALLVDRGPGRPARNGNAVVADASVKIAAEHAARELIIIARIAQHRADIVTGDQCRAAPCLGEGQEAAAGIILQRKRLVLLANL